MGVQKPVQPDYSSQTGTEYPTNIDKALSVVKRHGDWFAPYQQDVGSPSPDLSVRLAAGFTWDGTTFTEVAAQSVSGFTAPSAGQHRIDRVVVHAVTGAGLRVAGTAATGSPTASPPSIPEGYIPVCQVLLTDSDTAVLNSMITDERAFRTSSNGQYVRTRVFVAGSPNPDTWTKPAGLKRVRVTVIGGGASGAGGVATGASQVSTGSGGGAGGAAIKTIEASALGATESVAIGLGGAASSTTGNNGGTSSFGSHCSATGGVGGNGAGPSTSASAKGVLGGIGTGGDLNIRGGSGHPGHATNAEFSQAGGGGDSILGGGGPAPNDSQAAGAGGAYGAGGSGAARPENQALINSGAGANGVVIVEEFF